MSLRRKLFHQSEEKARSEFVGSSLASSRLISEHLRTWVESSDRGRPLVMQFHSEWQHRDCPVMQWYDQQRQSSTKFRCIKHRRILDGLFFHEYLLLKLTDGAICRVERTGEGSRTDAIRYIGCTANDIIQWFESETEYQSCSAKLLSESIAEVDLGREFDILDVLAACYSIQNTKACRAYTLQRYNCYFLCLTILAVLTRSVASWETKIKADEWDSSLTAMYERWSSLSSNEATQHDILTICAYIEPDNPRCAQFIFNMLREHLGSQAAGFAQCNEMIRLTLWRADWQTRLQAGLVKLLEVTSELFEDMGYCSQQLKRAIETSQEDAKQAILSSEALIAKGYFKIRAKEACGMRARLYEPCKNLQRWWRIEHPVSFNKLASIRMAGSLTNAMLALKSLSLFADNSYESRLWSHMSIRQSLLALELEDLINELPDELNQLEVTNTLHIKETSIITDISYGSWIVRLLDGLSSTGVLQPSELLLVLADYFGENEDSLVQLLALLAAPGLNDMLSLLTDAQYTKINYILGDLESDSKCATIEEFQETYIKSRIAAHANRVALHRLAAEKFVTEDIEDTMTEVWKGLPSGFGAVGLATSLEEEETI
ncbi:hypothetical protein FRC12_006336 [Ceratobasidium sp. 428]|nr:hypothetical protein FRC12_006336 [Ceratobasidium sp. 428]